ncbi:Uncharacterised protein [Vibrio cholerae]|nr:Uncharacterised protein [Vibrio cholerae]
MWHHLCVGDPWTNYSTFYRIDSIGGCAWGSGWRSVPSRTLAGLDAGGGVYHLHPDLRQAESASGDAY